MRIEGFDPEQRPFRVGFESARPYMLRFNGSASEWAMERKPEIHRERLFGRLIDIEH